MAENAELDPKLIENQQPQEVAVKLEVNINEVNVIMAALQELPHRVADPLLRKLMQQAQAQLQG
jgi:hypothetical protein